MTTKQCRMCRQVLLLSEFGLSPRNAGGYATACKPCSKVQHSIWVAKNPERVKALSLKHYQLSRQDREAANQYQKQKQRRSRAVLSDGYVKKAIVQGSKLKNRDITEEMVLLKRQQLVINRLAKQLKEKISESSKDPS